MQLEEEVLLCLDRIPVHMSAMTDTAAFTRVLVTDKRCLICVL